jgi:hypothetical protein
MRTFQFERRSIGAKREQVLQLDPQQQALIAVIAMFHVGSFTGQTIADYQLTSEHDSGIELHYAWRAAGRGDLSEARGRNVDIGSGEDYPVEWIERVGLEC